MRNLLAESIKVTLPTGTTSRTLEDVIIDLEMYEAEQECEVVTTAFTYEDINGPCEACLYGLEEEMGCHCNDHGGVTSIQVFSLVTEGRLIMSLALNDAQVCAMEDYLKGYTKTKSFSCYETENSMADMLEEEKPMTEDELYEAEMERRCNDTLQSITCVECNVRYTDDKNMSYLHGAGRCLNCEECMIAMDHASMTSERPVCSAKETTNDKLTNEVIPMDNMNKSQLVSTMAAELFQNGLSPIVSLVTSTAFIGAIEHMDDMGKFIDAFAVGLERTTIEVKNNDVEYELNAEEVLEALTKANYLASTEEMGTRLIELCALRQEAYAPNLSSEGITRRFGYAPVVHSELFKEAVHALEETEYTVDSDMLSIALQVQAVLGADKDDEAYVLLGCSKMDPELAYVSEFKGDRRGRIYQAACHGPNGQASDRSRALMNLVGVPTDYDIAAVKKVIFAEIKDMAKDVKAASLELKTVGDVQFILNHDLGKKVSTNVSKPWSFVKAAKIMRELQAGNRPYIGMAVGLDAKCSGPQLGALMVGDQRIAAACGMTMEEMEDAYHIAIASVEKAGFVGLSRAGIKKSYMGIFYGQGWAAFTNTKDLIEEGQQELVDVLFPDGVVSDDVAKRFHRAVSSSFGARMIAVRNLIKDYGKKTVGRTKHFMPDGFQVAMNYKEKVNVLNEAMGFNEDGSRTETHDVFLQNNAEQFKFINFQLKTKHVHAQDFARNGFVNMIQATDALIARLIIVHLHRLGAKHIISVHDCFRVNVTEMALLEKAIKSAYRDLFGSWENKATKDLPMGTDILGLYFQGANKQLVEGENPRMVSQFSEVKMNPFTKKMTKGERELTKINGVSLISLIEALGTTYYFAK
jgi:hypothetical protein